MHYVRRSKQCRGSSINDLFRPQATMSVSCDPLGLMYEQQQQPITDLDPTDLMPLLPPESFEYDASGNMCFQPSALMLSSSAARSSLTAAQEHGCGVLPAGCQLAGCTPHSCSRSAACFDLCFIHDSMGTTDNSPAPGSQVMLSRTSHSSNSNSGSAWHLSVCTGMHCKSLVCMKCFPTKSFAQGACSSTPAGSLL